MSRRTSADQHGCSSPTQSSRISPWARERRFRPAPRSALEGREGEGGGRGARDGRAQGLWRARGPCAFGRAAAARALARALILKPKVLLLLDEAALGSTRRSASMQVELTAAARSASPSFPSPMTRKKLVMSDRIAVMFEGEIAQLADPEKPYRRPNCAPGRRFHRGDELPPAQILGEAAGHVQLDVGGLGRRGDRGAGLGPGLGQRSRWWASGRRADHPYEKAGA